MSSVCPFFHFYFLCFILNLLPPPIYTLFPYTTLFRSKGTEIAGAFKNIVAIASGLVNGQKLGKNLESIILTKGLQEMLLLGASLSMDSSAFLGVAGVGDLIAASPSNHSRK